MAQAQALLNPDSPFPYWKWKARLPALVRQYRDNQPFPHIHLAELLEAGVAGALAEEFPRPDTEAWIHYKHHNENKLGMTKRELFPAGLGEVADELNSLEFVAWLSQLTGIPDLLPDPSLEGGGLHQSGRGGFLNVHTDFTTHHYHKNWRRRVNLILYLNPDWQDAWGGALELWDISMKHCVAKYAPALNHAVVFTTDHRSLHGFPEPLQCPSSESRKSLAFYYYTLEENVKLTVHSTDYRPRPSDSLGQAALIWLDKKAVDLYSRAKARFGFSDDFASRVLGFLSRKK
jgi:Rps23 Pro-64 3,4-dihydroxylase Tpa1-like proline 4-hydroxylase